MAEAKKNAPEVNKVEMCIACHISQFFRFVPKTRLIFFLHLGCSSKVMLGFAGGVAVREAHKYKRN